MIDRYTNFVLRSHKTFVLLSLCICFVLSAGLKNLSFTNDFEVFFSEKNPQLEAYKALEAIYGKQDSVSFYIEPKRGDIFQRDVLTLVHELTDASWELPFIDRVVSLSNYQHTEASDDSLRTFDLYDDPESLDEIEIQRIRKIVLNENTLLNRLISKTAKATSVVGRVDLPGTIDAPNQVVEAAERVMEEYRKRYPEVNIHVAGSATAGVNLGRAVERDLSSLVLVSYIAITLGLLLLLRSMKATFTIVFLITIVTTSTMGLYGWFSYVLTPVAGWVPSIVMTIAVADAVHILISYFHALRTGRAPDEAIVYAMRINANPVFVTSLTTVLGVLTLNFSDSPPYQDLGNMVAVGVILAYLLSMTFLPALALWAKIGKNHLQKGENQFMPKLGEFIIRRRFMLLILFGSLLVTMSSFIPRNVLTERWLDYYDDTYEIRKTIDAINENISGVHGIRYEINSGEVDGIFEPEYMKTLDKTANWIRQQPGIVYVNSLADIIKRLNKTFHNDNPDFYVVPDTRELIAQLYLLYEIGLPPELNMSDTVNPERQASLLAVVLNKTDSDSILKTDIAIEHWMTENIKKYNPSEGTGLDVVFAFINQRNSTGLLKGTLLALLLISLVLFIALRSVKLGLISLLPNLAPAALAYGTWGLLVGEVDLAASVVICMSLGIVVDDTVHFLSKFNYAQQHENKSTLEALRYAFKTVALAMCITSIVLVSGFLVLALSHFSPTWVTGSLMAMTLTYAIVADLLLLPPLLLFLDRFKKSRGPLEA